MYLLHWTHQSLLLALLTEWVLGGVAVTDMFPFPSIFTAYTVILLVASVLLLFMLLTKTPLGQLRASGKGTRPLWFPWHRLHLPCGRKPPQDSDSPAKALLTFFSCYQHTTPGKEKHPRYYSHRPHHAFPYSSVTSLPRARFFLLYAEERSMPKRSQMLYTALVWLSESE